jgi:hypothetical protein
MRRLAIWLTAVVVAVAGIVVASNATADDKTPPVGPSVVAIHAPCAVTHPWPGDDVPISKVVEQFSQNFGLQTSGNGWTDANRRQIKVLWQTLDSVACTDFLPNLKSKVNDPVGVNAASISGFAWGDWSLTKAGYVTFDFTKWKSALDDNDVGHLSRLIIHEFTHTLNADRFSDPQYWRDFQALAAKQGTFSSYAGSQLTETLPEVVGYYVARCAKDNPYDTGKFSRYYEWVKANIFAGREFGPAPGQKASCNVTADDIAAAEAAKVPAWVRALSGD